MSIPDPAESLQCLTALQCGGCLGGKDAPGAHGRRSLLLIAVECTQSTQLRSCEIGIAEDIICLEFQGIVGSPVVEYMRLAAHFSALDLLGVLVPDIVKRIGATMRVVGLWGGI